MPGNAATGNTYSSEKLRWLQSELSFTPNGPRWSQTAGGKSLPFNLLQEGSKKNHKPQLHTPGFGDPMLPASKLVPFPVHWGLSPRELNHLKTKLPVLPSPSPSKARLNVLQWQVLQNTCGFPSSFPEWNSHFLVL